VATGDGSPTSGGAGDVVRTEDTFTATRLGLLGIKLADGKVLTGRTDEDRGPASPDTPLDVVDARLLEVIGVSLAELYFVLDGIYGLARTDGLKVPQARAVSLGSVAGSLTSQLIIPADPTRLTLQGTNDTSSGILYLLPGSGKASSAQGGYIIQLNPGDYWEALPNQVTLPWVGVWSVATGFFNWAGCS
jgi:hypothetical protein